MTNVPMSVTTEPSLESEPRNPREGRALAVGDARSFGTKQANTLRAVVAVNPLAHRSVLVGAKDSRREATAEDAMAPAKSSAFGPPGLDTPSDPLERRQ